MIPAAVYRATVRLWNNSGTDADESTVREWAVKLWAEKTPAKRDTLALWVISWAAQVGHE